MTKGVFSEFEVKEQWIKVAGEENYSTMSCVGSSEEELEVKVITKKCRGVKAKEKVKGTGSGTLTESLHVPRDVYNKMYDMTRANLKEGVYAYGQNSSHPEFSITQRVLDEDDEEKFKAYPRCILESGPKRSVENGQEEVPELELTITLLPDDNGECMYEALKSELDEEVAEKWLEHFDTSLVQSTVVPVSDGQ
jgi:hypothetical protein